MRIWKVKKKRRAPRGRKILEPEGDSLASTPPKLLYQNLKSRPSNVHVGLGFFGQSVIAVGVCLVGSLVVSW